MAETSIEWADYTQNFWIGCTKVSAACDHCYAADYGHRFGVEWGPGKARRRTSESNWKQPLAWDRKAARDGTRPRVFCASLADIFDQEVPDEWRHEVMALIRATPNLIWLLLTKRPKAMADWSTKHGLPANVWAGTTCEDQKMADLRVPELLRTGATKRFLSCEPLLGPIDFSSAAGPFQPFNTIWWDTKTRGGRPPQQSGIDWVITGGESGPKARPSHPDWFRSLRDQCAAAGVAYLHKQNGEWLQRDCVNVSREHGAFDPDGTFTAGLSVHTAVSMLKTHVVMERLGKKAAGRLLDGVEHNGFPENGNG